MATMRLDINFNLSYGAGRQGYVGIWDSGLRVKGLGFRALGLGFNASP